jgi:hypothetical protein
MNYIRFMKVGLIVSLFLTLLVGQDSLFADVSTVTMSPAIRNTARDTDTPLFDYNVPTSLSSLQRPETVAFLEAAEPYINQSISQAQDIVLNILKRMAWINPSSTELSPGQKAHLAALTGAMTSSILCELGIFPIMCTISESFLKELSPIMEGRLSDWFKKL